MPMHMPMSFRMSLCSGPRRARAVARHYVVAGHPSREGRRLVKRALAASRTGR